MINSCLVLANKIVRDFLSSKLGNNNIHIVLQHKILFRCFYFSYFSYFRYSPIIKTY